MYKFPSWLVSGLLFAIFLHLSGCGSTSLTTNGGSSQNAQQSSQTETTQPTRTIQHVAGKTQVPQSPERVVALDNIALDSVLALGVTPVAALYNENTGKFPVHLRDRLQGKDVTKLSPTQQNIEQITAVKPDLIVGGKNVEPVYDLLSQVAPTVLLGQSGSSNWKDKLQLVGKTLGKPEAADQLLQDYRDRLANLREQLGDKADKLEISVVRIFPDRVRLYQKDSFIGRILEDAGLSRPSAQNKDRLWSEVSRENLDAADGDVIFVWTLGDEAESALQKLQSDRLWSQLDAVQAGKVYEVPGYWIGRGPIAANAVIDDLFQYLVE
jgi:iron complex transport system substrate-binding protein